jgi:hypothetical protein
MNERTGQDGSENESTETEERATIVSSPTVDGCRVQSHVVGTTGGTVELGASSNKSVKFICNLKKNSKKLKRILNK